MAEISVDVVIVGAGPAGLAAALYTGRDRHQTVVLDRLVPGGQINLTDRIENYPGHVRISGPDLVEAMLKQARAFGAEIKTSAEVTALQRRDDGRVAVHTDDDTYLARVVILCPGSDYRKLGVPGEDKFRQAGSGVSYCGTCDAPFFRDKHVVAVGGGNTAVEEAVHLSKYCSKVTLIHRRDQFRATPVLVEEMQAVANEGKIEVRYDTIVTEITGGDHVEGVTLKHVKTNAEESFACDGVFIFVGTVPNTDFLRGSVDLDDHGYIRCDPMYLRTSMPGVFVAGDCHTRAAMQLATATGDGVQVAVFMKEYLRDPSWWDKR